MAVAMSVPITGIVEIHREQAEGERRWLLEAVVFCSFAAKNMNCSRLVGVFWGDWSGFYVVCL